MLVLTHLNDFITLSLKNHYLIVFSEWFLNLEKAFARKSLFRTSTIPVSVWSVHSLTWMWIKVKEKNPKVWANLAIGHSRHRAQAHNTFRGVRKCFNFLKSEEKINIIQPVLHMSLYQHIIFCNTYIIKYSLKMFCGKRQMCVGPTTVIMKLYKGWKEKQWEKNCFST